MKAYKNIQNLPLERRIKATFGRLVGLVTPATSARVRAKPFSAELNYHERLLRNARQYQAVAEKDHQTLQQFLIDYWSSDFSQDFINRFGHRFETLFLRHHSGIVSELGRGIENAVGKESVELLELGCGDGKVLNYLSEHLTDIDRFTGIDLNREEISNCRSRYTKKPKLHFTSSDVFQWIDQFQGGNLILYTNGGVLEYFTREQLIALFSLVERKSNSSWIALTETLATDHNLEWESETYPYGWELAFSHNYPSILKESGYSIQWEQDRFTTAGEENHPTRWLQIVSSNIHKTNKHNL